MQVFTHRFPSLIYIISATRMLGLFIGSSIGSSLPPRPRWLNTTTRRKNASAAAIRRSAQCRRDRLRWAAGLVIDLHHLQQENDEPNAYSRYSFPVPEKPVSWGPSFVLVSLTVRVREERSGHLGHLRPAPPHRAASFEVHHRLLRLPAGPALHKGYC